MLFKSPECLDEFRGPGAIKKEHCRVWEGVVAKGCEIYCY